MAVVGASCTASWAATHLFDFNTDPSASGLLTITGAGSWQPTGGAGAATNANDGYLVISAGTSQSTQIIFSDFDNGLIVQAFTFEADLRVGNGTASPADGFSVNYCRANDPVLTGGAFATGQNCEANLPEEGTQTGIGIGLDAWDSGGTAGALCNVINQSIGLDVAAVTVRVDGTLVLQNACPTRNPTNPGDPTSIQTGPYDGTGSFENLTWQHLKVELTADSKLSVWWKGAQILTNYQTTYFPSAGRLVFAGRCGGSWENQHVDNILITTHAATSPIVGNATGYPDGCSVPIVDSGLTVDITKPYSMAVNGNTVPATISKTGGTTTITWHGYPTLLPPGSTNTVTVTATDSAGGPISGTRTFTVPVYQTVPAAWAVTGVDTSKKGLQMKTWQSSFENNINWWAQEQLAGMHGTNEADTTSFTDNGFFDFITGPGPVGVINMDYGANTDGNFTGNNGYPENTWPGLTTGGNGLNNIDHCAADIQCWLKFPAGGVYTMGVSSDDGFKVTTGPNPADWSALNVGEFNGGRGATIPGSLFTFVVTNAGVYPFRLMWENGTGGANCEWFSVVPWYGTPGVDGCYSVLITDPDPTNTTGIVAYYAGPAKPAFVSSLYPVPGSTLGDPILVKASITDAGTTVTAGSIQLSVNGTALAVTTKKAGNVTTVTGYRTSALAAGSVNTAQLVYTTTGTGGGTFTNTWTYTVPGSYAVLNAAWATTGVDTNKQGIFIRTWQSTGGNPSTQPNTIQWTEEQLAGLHGDNNVDPAVLPTKMYSQGYTNYTDVVNFNASTVTAQGVFQAYNDYTDILFPGLPSTAGSTGNASLEQLCYIYFDHAGLYSMGVNSDDGFKVTSGPSPADWLSSTLLGQFNGGRGSSTTTFSFLVTNAGFYPFRLIYENGNGELEGNGINCEWFTQDSSGAPALLNDPRTAGEFGTVKAYSSTPLFPAFVSAVQPYPGSGPVRPDATFLVNLTDGGTTVNASSVKAYINGKQLNATVAKSGGVTSVTMPTGYLLPGDTIAGQTQYALDTAAIVYTTGAGTFSNSWTFTVYPWGAVSPAWAVTGVTQPGFKVRPWKSSGVGGNNFAAQPNTIRWTEEQLAGAHGPNHADLTGADANGYLTFAGADLAHTINFDLAGSHDGNFTPTGALGYYPDNPWPGSGNPNSWDNSAEEFVGYMYLPSPGLYQFGVNSDDGFKVTVGTNPKDWINSTVCGFYNGGKGASDVTYFVNATNAGYYPMRLIWQNGGGGCNLEWFSVDTSGTRYLINDPDPTNSTGIAFYYNGPPAPAYVSEFWPADGATGVQDGWVSLTLKDGATTVTPGSITVTIDGAPVTPVIVSSGGTTKIYSPIALPAGTYTAVVTYSTSGGGPYTAKWSFTTTSYQWGVAMLSTNLWTPPGSGTNAGFSVKAYQSSAQGALTFNGWQNVTRMADQCLQGYYDTNALTDTTVDYTNNGAMWWPGVINFSQNSAGALTANGASQAVDGTPDSVVPGLPALSGNMNDDAYEAKMFLEFPTAGPYTMGFNSDDGFRLTTGDQGSPDKTGLSVIAPASVAKAYTAMYTTTADEGGNNGFGRTPPSTVPIIARAVVCDPADYASGTLNNAAALNGAVAVVLHNGNMANQCNAIKVAAPGVLAIIVANNSGDSATPYPGTRGSGSQDVALPLVSTTYACYQDLLTDGATTTATSPVIVRVTAQDCSTICGKYDNGKGASDVFFTIQVPAPGVYPFRLIWENGGGDANSEFFTIDPATGIRTLINDAACPVKSWIKRNVHAAGALPAPVLKTPTTDASGNVIISWTGEGELWEAYSLTGPWFKSTYQSNPSAVVPTPLIADRFFRVRMY